MMNHLQMHRVFSNIRGEKRPWDYEWGQNEWGQNESEKVKNLIDSLIDHGSEDRFRVTLHDPDPSESLAKEITAAAKQDEYLSHLLITAFKGKDTIHEVSVNESCKLSSEEENIRSQAVRNAYGETRDKITFKRFIRLNCAIIFMMQYKLMSYEAELFKCPEEFSESKKLQELTDLLAAYSTYPNLISEIYLISVCP